MLRHWYPNWYSLRRMVSWQPHFNCGDSLHSAQFLGNHNPKSLGLDPLSSQFWEMECCFWNYWSLSCRWTSQQMLQRSGLAQTCSFCFACLKIIADPSLITKQHPSQTIEIQKLKGFLLAETLCVEVCSAAQSHFLKSNSVLTSWEPPFMHSFRKYPLNCENKN